MTPEIRPETFIAASALGMTCIGIDIIRAAIAEDDPDDELGLLRRIDGILGGIADFRKELEAVRAGQQLKTIDAEAPKQIE